MAKGVASAYAAISCTVTTEEVFKLFQENPDDPFDYFRDISTFGACTIGPAAALENFRIIEEEGLVANAASVGSYLKKKLEAMMATTPMIGDVRGKGLLLGIELVVDKKSKQPVPEQVAAEVVAKCMQRGVIIGRTNRSFERFNNTLCLSPPLTLSVEQADQLIDTLNEVFADMQVEEPMSTTA